MSLVLAGVHFRILSRPCSATSLSARLNHLPHNSEHNCHVTMVDVREGKKSKGGEASALPLASRLSTLQTTLSSSTDLNPLCDLLALIDELATVPDAASALLPKSMSLLMHSLSALVRATRVPLDAHMDAEGRLHVSAHNEKDANVIVRRWIAERFNESVECLCALLGHTAAHVRVSQEKACRL